MHFVCCVFPVVVVDFVVVGNFFLIYIATALRFQNRLEVKKQYNQTI